jgi:ADP-ribose pyrophosphatase
VYKGYVDDPRNTDNAWMETEAWNFHDESGDVVGCFDFQAGSDASHVQWVPISGDLKLYASHSEFVERVANIHNAHF